MPKTSYYKLIDWWLTVALNSLVLTMGFHTYLANLVSKSKKKHLELTSNSRIFNPRSSGKVENVANVDMDYLKTARRRNEAAKIIFAILIILFNIFFWYLAISEQLTKPESYL